MLILKICNWTNFGPSNVHASFAMMGKNGTNKLSAYEMSRSLDNGLVIIVLKVFRSNQTSPQPDLQKEASEPKDTSYSIHRSDTLQRHFQSEL